MFGFKPPYQGAGDPIPARALNTIYEQVARLSRLGVGPGLTIKEVAGAPIIGLAGGPLRIRNAKVTSAITARSGSVKGHGTVTIYADTGDDTGTLTDVRSGVKVWNVYAAAIAVNKWVIIGTVDGLDQVLGGDC